MNADTTGFIGGGGVIAVVDNGHGDRDVYGVGVWRDFPQFPAPHCACAPSRQKRERRKSGDFFGGDETRAGIVEERREDATAGAARKIRDRNAR